MLKQIIAATIATLLATAIAAAAVAIWKLAEIRAEIVMLGILILGLYLMLFWVALGVRKLERRINNTEWDWNDFKNVSTAEDIAAQMEVRRLARNPRGGDYSTVVSPADHFRKSD